MLSRRPLAQVRCDFSFQSAALSTPANPGHNDLDEQKTGEDGQNNEQIKIFFRHCPCLSVKRQSNAETVTKGAKNCREWRRRPEMSSRRQAQDALALSVRYSNGRFSPRVTGGDTRDAVFRKSLMKTIYRKFPKTASLSVTCHPAFIGERDPG